MKIVYIEDSKFVFGFMKDFPAICSQGSSREEVKRKIIRYYEKK